MTAWQKLTSIDDKDAFIRKYNLNQRFCEADWHEVVVADDPGDKAAPAVPVVAASEQEIHQTSTDAKSSSAVTSSQQDLGLAW